MAYHFARKAQQHCWLLKGNKMADINFDCPHCGHNLDVNERGAGLTVACPECSKNIEIPMPAPEVLVSNIIFNCGSCGHPLKAAPDMAGLLIDCPACKKPTEIPFAPRPTPLTPTRPAARSTPIHKPPSQSQVPGTETSNPYGPAATRPSKANSPGLVIAVIFLALACAGMTARMIFLIKNRNGGSTTAQGTPLAPTKEYVLFSRPTAEKEPLVEKVLPDVDGNGSSTNAQGTPVVLNKKDGLLARPTAEKAPLEEKVLPDVTVDGEVFIVTKDRQNIKLGLVEVALIPMQTMMPYLEMKHVTLTNRLAGLEQEIKTSKMEKDRLSKAVQVAKAEVDRVEEFHLSFETIEAEMKRIDVRNNTNIKSLEQVHQACEKARQACEKAREADYAAFEKIMKLTDLQTELMSARFYFESIPSPLLVTKTNSDGKFRLIVPGTGSFAVVSIASRHVGDDVERYYWLLKIDPRAGANQTIMLSNDNLMSADGVAVFIQTK